MPSIPDSPSPLFPSVRAVVFDLDGTLLDTVTDIANAANHALEQHGFAAHDLGTIRRFVGNGARKLIERALPEGHRDTETIDRALQAFGQTYAEALVEATRPYDGIPELLDHLEARGLPMAILSNKPHPLTRRCAELLLSKWPFDPVLGQRPGFPAKPDPTVPGLLALHFGLEPAEVVLVGDTAVDIETAKAVGMPSIGVLWGFRGREELAAAGADALVAHPSEIGRLLSAAEATER